MANMYGADVQQLTDLASAMDQASSQLSATRQSVSAKVQQSSWVGPDAERFRSTWSSTNNARVASASQLLSDAAVTLRKNAAEQTQASSASGGSTGVLIPISATAVAGGTGQVGSQPSLEDQFFAGTQSAMNTDIPGTPWSVSQIGGLVPGVGVGFDAMDMANSMHEGQVPILSMVDVAGGALRDDPATYLGGVAVGVWGTVGKDLTAAISLGPPTNDLSYIASDPVGALDSVVSAEIQALPDLIGDFL